MQRYCNVQIRRKKIFLNYGQSFYTSTVISKLYVYLHTAHLEYKTVKNMTKINILSMTKSSEINAKIKCYTPTYTK